ncbi:hypothetical protein L6164_008411 [Bauhinia variegata]|uniref:Uncharacterized protein n=1 Tax=Bauhinia variegata TaxID=167791 RepID=A0ACB9PHT0_BAUVA|nr:hypothetical protein L6164_008411 [Bauhinia variegata]
MAQLSHPITGIHSQLACFTCIAETWSIGRRITWDSFNSSNFFGSRKAHLRYSRCLSMASSSSRSLAETGKKSKKVWMWTKNKQVMTAAVERGWNTFIFSPQQRQLANDWSFQSLLWLCVW